jgi:hypothetical protein
MNVSQKSKVLAGSIGGIFLLASATAGAAVPAAVTTALTDAGADTVSVAGTVLAVIVGIMALKYVRRAL